ncbi:MAG: Tad domain-containing protein [Planctomycetota bacterium]|nr:Tad domain-containing protein [Planctomycetota bacterium]
MTNITLINKTRKAAILPMLAVSMVALVGIIALAVDIGILAQTKSQLQSVADAAALSGSRGLTGDAGSDNNKNAVNGLVLSTIQASTIMGQTLQASQLTTQVGYYNYDAVLGKFQTIFTGSKPATENWSAVKTDVSFSQPTSLANFFNYSAFSATATATAVHRPRDLAIILDYSGSMRFNSIPAYPTNGSISGSMNPDPNIPRFGPWSTITSVMQRTTQNGDSAPNNHTIETNDGPPIVKDFYSKQADGSYINAFYRPLSPYNWRTTSTNFALPAPDNFQDQSNTPVQFTSSSTGMGGDRWPKTNGYNLGAVPNNTGSPYASTVQQYVSGNTTSQANSHAKNVAFESAGYTDFQGFTMGPGYYGKTFYMWPPDPRAANDWRKKFFFYGSNSTTPCDDNSLLFSTNNGKFRTASTTSYKINYTAVMNWINSGPKVFPDNMRAGRVLYYDSIPTTIPDTGGTLDQKFWRAYIDYVIGAGNQTQILYGQNATAYGTTKITAKASLTASPAPYMHYNDNPIHPRLNFWFGPVSFLSFLSDYRIGRNWLPGTSHESATWQLKAGIQSAIVDIQKNHPNDQAALIYFSTLDNYNVARVPMGKDYTRMSNALFYPYSLLDSLSDPNAEIRPYGSSFNTSYLGTISSSSIDAGQWDNKSSGEIPNADGGTDPEMSFMAAYNQFSSATGFNGRKGANKMIIFETDGQPTSNASGTFQSGGAYLSKFTSIADAGSSGADATSALNTLQYVCNLTTANPSGYSTIKNPVSVHSIAFGQLFETNSTSTGTAAAMDFLVKCQIKGNTSPTGATTLNSEKIIIGNYNERIEKIRSAFERVLQSGIQITLIE